MSTEERVYAGQAAGERIGDRRAQLIEAGAQLLAGEGAAGVTMRAVTRLARLSPRYFYESFPTRADLLVAVFDHVAAEAQRVVLAAVEQAPREPHAQTRAVFAAFAALCEEDPRIPGILLRETIAEPALRERARAIAPAAIEAIGMTLADPDWSTAAGSARVHLDVSALAGAVSNLYLDWTSGSLDVTAAELVDYCADLVAGMVQQRDARRT